MHDQSTQLGFGAIFETQIITERRHKKKDPIEGGQFNKIEISLEGCRLVINQTQMLTYLVYYN